MLRPRESLGSRQLFASIMIVGVIACDRTAVSPGEHGVDGLTQAPAQQYSAWSAPISVEGIPGTHTDFNTASLDGCPFISPDGKSFYMASNRTGTLGGLDIWVSTRSSVNEGWGEPQNVGEPVNSSADDFCPTMARDGNTLYFVSRRSGGCGLGDIYVARLRAHADGDFDDLEILPCDATAPYDAVNSPFDEFSPFPVNDFGAGPVLYFSSFRPGGHASEAPGANADSDVYVSASNDGVFGAPALVAAVNTDADDGQPNVSSDGLELYFYSTRVIAGSSGAADLYVATRSSPSGTWLPATNLGVIVNSAGGETRPSLSWDRMTLYFGSTRAGGEGMSDIYVTTRTR